MILFSIYDRLSNSQKDLVQVIDNLDLVKRDLLSKYKKLLTDKDNVNLDKFLDHKIITYGVIKEGVITLYGKDEMIDISLIKFLDIKIGEDKANECKSN